MKDEEKGFEREQRKPKRKPKNVGKVLTSDEFKDLRAQSSFKIKDLDIKIETYVDEIMKMLLPVDASNIEKSKLKDFLLKTISIEIYYQRISALFEQIWNVSRNKQPLDIDAMQYYENFHANRTQDYLTRIPILHMPSSPAGEKKFQRRYTVEPNSPDLQFKIENRIVEEEMKENLKIISAKRLKRMLKNNLYLRVALGTRDYIQNGGNLEKLPIENSMFETIEKQYTALRKVLLEKVMIFDGKVYDFMEYKDANLFPIVELLHIYHRYMIANEKTDKILAYATQDLQYARMSADYNQAMDAFRATVELNSGRLSNVPKTASGYRRVTDEIIESAAIDLAPIGDKEAIKTFRSQARSYLRTNIHRENITKKSAPVTHTYTGNDELSSTAKGVICGAGLLAIYGTMLLAAINSPEAQELIGDKSSSPPKDTGRIVAQADVDLATTITGNSDYEIVLPGKDGEEIILNISECAEEIESIIDENIRENYLAEQEFADLSYVPKHAIPIIPDTEPTITVSDLTEAKTGYQRRRRVDRYKDQYEDGI